MLFLYQNFKTVGSGCLLICPKAANGVKLRQLINKTNGSAPVKSVEEFYEKTGTQELAPQH